LSLIALAFFWVIGRISEPGSFMGFFIRVGVMLGEDPFFEAHVCEPLSEGYVLPYEVYLRYQKHTKI
jgi:hypothetical protein